MKRGLTGRNRKRLSSLNIFCLGARKQRADVITAFSVLKEISFLQNTDVCNVAKTQAKLHSNGDSIEFSQDLPPQ